MEETSKKARSLLVACSWLARIVVLFFVITTTTSSVKSIVRLRPQTSDLEVGKEDSDHYCTNSCFRSVAAFSFLPRRIRSRHERGRPTILPRRLRDTS
jgi:hypothetical protein